MSDGEGTPNGIAASSCPADWDSLCDTAAGTMIVLPDDKPIDEDTSLSDMPAVPSPVDADKDVAPRHEVAPRLDDDNETAGEIAPVSDAARPDVGKDENDPIPPVDRRHKHQIALAVAVAASLMLVGMVSVLSWASSLGGGAGAPVDTTAPRPDAGGEGTNPAQPHAVPSGVSSLEISFAAGMSATVSADGQSLSWDAAGQAASGALGSSSLSCDGDAVTLSFADGDCPSAVYLSVSDAAGGFVSWGSTLSADEGLPMSFSGSVGGLPASAGIYIDLPDLTASCSPQGEDATPVITMSLSQLSPDGSLGESADAALALGQGASDAALTTTMREVTMRSSDGVGHGTRLTGTRVSPAPGTDAGQQGTGGTVTLDDGVREYVANYDELAQRSADEGKGSTMPSLVTDVSVDGEQDRRPVSTEGGMLSVDLDGDGASEALSVHGGGDEPLSLVSDGYGIVELAQDGLLASAATGKDQGGAFLELVVDARDGKPYVTTVRLREGRLVAE